MFIRTAALALVIAAVMRRPPWPSGRSPHRADRADQGADPKLYKVEAI
ncbi:MAG TPA: hypothetical protein VFZ00_31820 [Solirubrobacter sp.]|nr:hypothetical protein [Solirubrobacter sp.]